MKYSHQIISRSSPFSSVLFEENRPGGALTTIQLAEARQRRFQSAYGHCTMCETCKGFTGGYTTCQNCGHPFDRHVDD